jgi:uncharacterized membrane protein YgaE (UPF0421/DUF939 family)
LSGSTGSHTRALPLRRVLRRGRMLVRRGRPPGLRTAKTTVAAMASYALADWIGTSAQPVLAPLTALLVVQVTLYQTLSQGVRRVGSVLAGVLLAVGVANVVGLTWWSLGAVVAVSLVLGRLLRLGAQLLEVPISAMLVLAVGGAQDVAAGRVYETVLGAAVGVVVNVVIAPPLYLQPAGDAVGDLADRLAQFVHDLAAALREGWSRAAADRWLDEARALSGEVQRADQALARAEESARMNPRGRQARRVQPRLHNALTALEHSYVALRELCRALLDRTYFVPAEEEASVYSEQVRGALAEILEAAADALNAVGAIGSGKPDEDEQRTRVDADLHELDDRREQLSRLLLTDPHADPAAWAQHGALLAAIDRLRVEVETAARRPDQTWRPPPLTAPQRRAMRRIVERQRRLWGRNPRQPRD